MIEQPCQLGTVAARARELLFVDPAAASLGECGALKIEVLVVGRNPRVAEQHRRNLIANVIAKCYLFAIEFCNAGTAALSSAAPQSRNLGVLRRPWTGCFRPKAVARPSRWERVLLPHCGHCLAPVAGSRCVESGPSETPNGSVVDPHRRRRLSRSARPFSRAGEPTIDILRSVQIVRSGYSLSLVPSLRPSDPRRLASLSKETARLGEQDRIFGPSPGSHAVLQK
jgi:hypothetical protein